MGTTITAMHVRPVDTVADQPVIEVRLSGGVYRRWNGYYFVWARHGSANGSGIHGSQFDLTGDKAIKDLVDAAIATVLGPRECL